MRTLTVLILGAGAVATALLYPLVHLAVATINFVAHLFVLSLQVIVSRFAAPFPKTATRAEEEPFVSIHVPTHNEPPEIVIQTLRSLSELNWSNYEVLVIDNNTPDPEIWRPVEDYCAVLGPRFRFFHAEGLDGFKAGAMNYVRKFMDRRSSFIFVVDADYVVEPHALRTAFHYLTDAEIGLVQFPQSFRNVSAANVGLALEYKHFFSGFMTVANALECVPSTGTLALISVEALRRIGGFSTEFVTEDAELGLNLALNGYRSVYVNEIIGAGLIPHELDGLKKQRWRWAFGNAQILRRQWKNLLFSSRLTWKQKLGFISHLTAWFNFNLIPSLSLILLAFYSLLNPLGPWKTYTVVIAAFTLATNLVLKYAILHYSLRPEGHSLIEIWKAFSTHIGLGWIFSASWIRCLFNSSSPFVRTNKFLSSIVPGVLRTTCIELLLATGLLSACVIFTASDFALDHIASFAMACANVAIFWVWAQTRHTMKVTSELLIPRISEAPEAEIKRAA
jgi:cellulose synthase/poly-beta-1,6-N-acetylglucosamine synthase-like glycosyltransferase